MKPKELIERYQVLYKSGIETVIFLGLAKESDFVGCSDEELSISENEDGFDYPASICAYLKTFGVFCNMQDMIIILGVNLAVSRSLESSSL